MIGLDEVIRELQTILEGAQAEGQLYNSWLEREQQSWRERKAYLIHKVVRAKTEESRVREALSALLT